MVVFNLIFTDYIIIDDLKCNYSLEISITSSKQPDRAVINWD